MADDLGEKTEPASPRRKRQARLRGSMPRSSDLSGAIALAGAVAAVALLAPHLLLEWRTFLRGTLEGDFSINPVTTQGLLAEFGRAMRIAMTLTAPILAAVFVASYISIYLQVGWLITFEPLQLDPGRLNPIQGAKKFFNLRSAVRGGSSMAKILAAVGVAIYVVSRRFTELLMLPHLEYAEAIVWSAQMIMELLIWMIVLLFVLGIIDWAYQKWQWERDNRMSKQDQKEEIKTLQGDPKVKKQQRDFALKILMQRMSQAVPNADVVVTNPQHLAIALKWDPETMNAPRVVAKGADFLALRLRQIALMHNIPIVERQTLARAMYPLVEVGREIPAPFYAAIAEILAYVYRLSGKKVG